MTDHQQRWDAQLERRGRALASLELRAQRDLDALARADTSEVQKRQMLAVRQSLDQLRQQVREMRKWAQTLVTEEQRRHILDAVQRHDSVLQSLHLGLRKANIIAATRVERATREALFGESATARIRQHDEEAVRATARKITQSFKETRNLLAQEIARSGEAHEMLVASTKKLKAIHNDSNTYSSTLATGTRLISKNEQRQRTDNILLALGVIFFLAVVLYIVKKRLSPWVNWVNPFAWY